MSTTISLILGAATILGGIAAVWYFWDKISAWVFGSPNGAPGARIERAKSRRGNILADDKTGSGASIREVEAEYDITAKTGEPTDPKD